MPKLAHFDLDHLPTLAQYRAVVAGNLRDDSGGTWTGEPGELDTLRELWSDKHSRVLDEARGRTLSDEDRNTLDLAEREMRRFADAMRVGGGVRATDVNRSHLNAGGQRGWDGTHGRPGRPIDRHSAVVTSEQRVAEFLEVRGGNGEYSSAEGDEMSLGAILRAAVTGNRRDLSDAEARALGEGTDTAGGILVPDVLASRVIDLARNQTRVIQSGAMTVPMERDNMTIAKLAGDAEPTWRAENAVVTEDDVSFTSVTLAPKTLAVLCKASRELVMDGRNVENQLRDTFAKQFAAQLDMAALRGTGAASEPTGVLNQAGVTGTEIGAGNGDTIDWDDIIDSLIGPLEDANEEPTGIIWAPRTKRSFSKLKDGNLRYLDPPVSLRDLPRRDTNQIPTNLTTGTSGDTTEVYGADWRRLLIGVRTTFFFDVLKERFADNLQYGFLAFLRADVAVERAAAFSVLTGVRS